MKEIIKWLLDIGHTLRTTGRVRGRIRRSNYGKFTRIARGSFVCDSNIDDHVRLGKDCTVSYANIGRFTYLQDRSMVTFANLGSFCSIAENVRIGATNHDVSKVTTHEMTFEKSQGFIKSDDRDFFKSLELGRVVVGNDVWIGYGVVIMPEVTIGDGAVVGANSVVTKDVLPYSIVVGIPARHVRYRFDGGVIEKLREIKWFDWTVEKIRANILDFSNMDLFILRHYDK